MLDLRLLLAQLIVILIAAWLAGALVRPLGQPRVIGEILAGIALGPSLLGAVAPHVSTLLFPPARLLPLATLSQLGVLLFMFVVGLRIDLTVLRKRVYSAIAVSHASIAVPFVLGASLAPWLYTSLAGRGINGTGVALLPFALFLGAAMSVTAFPVLSRILAERGLQGSTLGSVALASAAIGDVTAWCVLAAVVAVTRAENGIASFALTLGGAITFAVLLTVVGRRLLVALDQRRLARTVNVSADVVGAAIVFALVCAFITERLGVHALFGSFIAGAVMPRSSELARGLADRMEAIVSTVFLPVFFVYTGLQTEIGLLSTLAMWGICAVVITAAIAGKFGGSTVAARLSGMSWRDAMGIGVLMNTRGLMELVVLNVGLELGVLSKPLFAIMIVMALVTTMMTSPLLAFVLRGTPTLDRPSANANLQSTVHQANAKSAAAPGQ